MSLFEMAAPPVRRPEAAFAPSAFVLAAHVRFGSMLSKKDFVGLSAQH
jgi:hypothetical protein